MPFFLVRLDLLPMYTRLVATLDPCAPDLAPTVKVFSGVVFVVARTTQKKLAPDCGADAKVIWSSLIVNEVSGS